MDFDLKEIMILQKSQPVKLEASVKNEIEKAIQLHIVENLRFI